MMKSQNNKSKECWIGLAHVVPKIGNNLLEGAIGAFVQILALANGIEEFVTLATNLLESYEFDKIEIEDIDLFKARLLNSDVHEDIKILAKNLTDKDFIAMHIFQSYENIE